MKKYLFIVMMSAALISTNVYSESIKPGTYKNLEEEKLGKVGELLLHPDEENHFLFSLKLNRGKPSYNSGYLYGNLQFKDKICILKFESKGNTLSIKTVNSNKQCGLVFTLMGSISLPQQKFQKIT